MQIDFHHTATYAIARLAGFKKADAEIIAYSAQYIDDATNDGLIQFKNGATYSRTATAHKMLDYRNFKGLANSRVWVPFHFLPGNDLKNKTDKFDVNARFINRLVCRPGSEVSKDMVKDCIADQDQVYGLHRLGITMHVYADTWGHYGFCGVVHEINNVSDVKFDGQHVTKSNFLDKMKSFFADKFDKTKGKLVGDVYPLGHGAALSYPDMPYLKWEYINGLNQKIIRDNPASYIEAVKSMYQAMVCYLKKDHTLNTNAEISNQDLETFKDLLFNTTNPDGESRHKIWLNAIKNGRFSFGKEDLSYIPKGEGSWKHQALGTIKEVDDTNEQFTYTDYFIHSDWKKFHDAASAHRFSILHRILPQYGIVVG